MRKPRLLISLCLTAALLLIACDGATTPTPAQPAIPEATVISAPTGTVVDVAAATPPPTPDESAPTPTPVTATSTGDALTVLQALAVLKPKALAWQADARLGMLSNVRPGQGAKVLAGTLGDPDVNEPTPGGKGRNWTLIAFSPSTKGAIAISIDGAQVDLVKESMVTDEVVAGFATPEMAPLDLSTLDPSHLVDSDAVLQKAEERATQTGTGVALLAPDGLGMGPLPTPQAGGSSPKLVYELFGANPTQQSFVFFDAQTGEIVLDSSVP